MMYLSKYTVYVAGNSSVIFEFGEHEKSEIVWIKS